MVKRVSRNGKGDKGQQSKTDAHERGVAFAPHGHVTAACKDCATRHVNTQETNFKCRTVQGWKEAVCSHEGGSLTRLDFDQEGQKRQRKKAEHLKIELISLAVLLFII